MNAKTRKTLPLAQLRRESAAGRRMLDLRRKQQDARQALRDATTALRAAEADHERIVEDKP